jgi:hypothetical protein
LIDAGQKDIEALVKLRVDWPGGEKLTASQYEVVAKVLPLAHHEYTHFIDSTSTVWGLAFLTKMNAAYSCNDSLRREESDFWPAKEFADVLRSIALPDYYTGRTKAKSTRPWEASITAGQIFDEKGRVTERTILFQRFLNGEKEPLVRSPISSASVLEASSMAQETALHMKFIGIVDGAFANTERQAFSARTAAFRERLAVPRDVTLSRRRRSRQPAIRRLVSASGAAATLRCGCSGGWEAAPAHRAGKPMDRVR